MTTIFKKCTNCNMAWHTRKTCPTPDNEIIKNTIYNMYINGGYFEGKHYYGEDYQGGAEYLSDQMDKKNKLMTKQQYDKYIEERGDW